MTEIEKTLLTLRPVQEMLITTINQMESTLNILKIVVKKGIYNEKAIEYLTNLSEKGVSGAKAGKRLKETLKELQNE